LLNGTYAIPAFQRDFVWDIERSAKLLDSWVKGYPMGSFILWKTDEALCPVKKIGNTVIYRDELEGEKTYILDGQQRITSVFAAIMGLNTSKKTSYTNVVVNLNANIDDHTNDIVTVRPNEEAFPCISFSELCGEISPLLQKYPNHLEKIFGIRDRLSSLTFHAIRIEGASIEVATEIFSRLNTGGKKLDIFDIMVAKTYRPKTKDYQEFNLADKVDNYAKAIPSAYKGVAERKKMLQLVSICLRGEVSARAQLSITRDEMIAVFDDVVSATNRAIDFCVNSLKIPVWSMVAYTSVFQLFVYFFYHYNKTHNLAAPSINQQRCLIDYYWRCVLNERFGSSTDSKTADDVKNVVDKILLEEQPEQICVMLSVDSFIARGEFKLARAFILGMIGLLMSKNPKSLSNNSLVCFDASWISKSQKNNYHHFFPQNMVGNNWTNEPVNNICNIILQDASTNQIEIGNRRPSDYIGEFLKTNPNLGDTLKDHLIDDIQAYGIPADDFDTFIKRRASAFIEELKTRLVGIETDSINSAIK
jgi:hypothetical protein